MRIAQVSRELGVSPEWIRALERAGQIRRAARDRHNHRRYRKEDLEYLRQWFYPGQVASDGQRSTRR